MGRGNVGFIKIEVKSMLKFWDRLNNLEEARWAKQVHMIKGVLGISAAWDRRIEFAARCLRYKKKEWEKLKEVGKLIPGWVGEAFDRKWREAMTRKSSLIAGRGFWIQM